MCPGTGSELAHHGTHNYGMSNVLAGIGRGQLEVLDLRIRRAPDDCVPLPGRICGSGRDSADAAERAGGAETP